MIMSQEKEVFKVEGLEELAEIARFLESCAADRRRLDEVERGLFQRLLKLGFTLLSEFVERAGLGDIGETVEHQEHTLYRSEEPRKKLHRSIFGVLTIFRYVYCRGAKQAAERKPVDEELGLPQGEQSYVLEDWSQRLTTEVPYAEAVGILKDLLGIDLSVRAAEAINSRMASYVDSFRDEQPPVEKASEADVLVVTADGKGVPMRRPQEDWLEEELGKKKVIRSSKVNYQKTDKRRGRGGRKSCKQMAYVGAVYSIGRFVRTPKDIIDEVRRRKKQAKRPKPQNKRLRAEMNQIDGDQLSYGQSRLFDWLNAEVISRDPSESKSVVCLMDGQKSLWYWKQKQLAKAVGILDLYHVLERLWKAAHCFHRESSVEAEQFVEKYLCMLLEGKVGSVIGVFRRFAKSLPDSKTTNLQDVIRYFDNNRDYMRYDEYIQTGYPIGSGVIEGACRHAVKDRMEGAGMRWQVEGAQAMLNLRTTRLNGNWNEFVEYRVQTEQQLNQTAA